MALTWCLTVSSRALNNRQNVKHISTLNFTRSTLPSLDWATHSRLKEKLGTPAKLCDQMLGSISRDIAKASPTCTSALLFLSCIEMSGLSSQVSNTFGTEIFKSYNALIGRRIPFNNFGLPCPEFVFRRASVSRKAAQKKMRKRRATISQMTVPISFFSENNNLASL